MATRKQNRCRFLILLKKNRTGTNIPFLAERRIGEHQVEPFAGIAAQAVIGLDRRLGLGAGRACPVLSKSIYSATSKTVDRARPREATPSVRRDVANVRDRLLKTEKRV